MEGLSRHEFYIRRPGYAVTDLYNQSIYLPVLCKRYDLSERTVEQIPGSTYLQIRFPGPERTLIRSGLGKDLV